VLPENRKRIFYFNTVKELNKYKNILLECGRQAEAIWSLNAATPMSEEALTTRDYVLSDHRLPPQVQDLLINSAYETAISIKDPLVKEMYIHTGNSDTREQARGRMRQDMEVVGYYNHERNKNEKSHQKLIDELKDYCAKIPDNYIGRKLTTEDKNELLRILNFPKKWPSLKKALEACGWEVIEQRNNKTRYSIIQKK
jgi:hypothetical protein